MHLGGGKAPHAPHFRIQASKEFCNSAWKLDADEEPFRPHSWLPSQFDSDLLGVNQPAGWEEKRTLHRLHLYARSYWYCFNGSVALGLFHTERQNGADETEKPADTKRGPAVFNDWLFQIEHYHPSTE